MCTEALPSGQGQPLTRLTSGQASACIRQEEAMSRALVSPGRFHV
jgi:hypothetical protein